jgi:threonine/homoserine/homoserine lactone efflux protein
VVDLASMNVLSFVEISLTIAIVLPVVMFMYVFLAARAREMFTTPKAVRRLNRSSGVAMASAAVVVATR